MEKREDEEEEGEDGAEREEVETRASVELPDEGGPPVQSMDMMDPSKR